MSCILSSCFLFRKWWFQKNVLQDYGYGHGWRCREDQEDGRGIVSYIRQKRSRRSRSSRQYWFGSGSSNLTNHYYQRGIVLLLLSTLQIIVQGRNPTTTDSSQFYTKEHILFSQGELYLLTQLFSHVKRGMILIFVAKIWYKSDKQVSGPFMI